MALKNQSTQHCHANKIVNEQRKLQIEHKLVTAGEKLTNCSVTKQGQKEGTWDL